MFSEKPSTCFLNISKTRLESLSIIALSTFLHISNIFFYLLNDSLQTKIFLFVVFE